jgi:hypothetical protein
MPPDGVLSCVLDRRALRKTSIPAVEMAVAIRDGEPQPARGREVHLLHVALIAAAEAPPVGRAEPASGKVSAPDFEASYVVFDVEGAERQLRTKPRSRTSGRKVRQAQASPTVRFGVLPRAAADALVSPEDELAVSLLSALPKNAGMPAVFVRYKTVSEAKAFVRAVEGGSYLGVSAQPTPVGTMLRLIGLGEPLGLGVVGTNWPPLRGFIRRREESGGLHAMVIAATGSSDLEGIFVCVLPQPAEHRAHRKMRARPNRSPSEETRRRPRRPRVG